MTTTTLRDTLAEFGFSQVRFAQLMRVNDRTVRKWLAGGHAVPGPVIAWIELYREYQNNA